jgi:hypothetical protein
MSTQYQTPQKALLLFSIFAVIATFITLQILTLPLSEWMASHWLYDYQQGFIKRGLTGEVLAFIAGEASASLTFIENAALTVYTLLVLALLLFVFFIFKQSPSLAFTFLLSGFSIQQFAYDFGRFDQINYLLSFIAIAMLFTHLPQLIKLGLLMTLSCTMLLVHEASLFLNIPLLFTLYFFLLKQSNSNHLPLLLSCYSAVILATAISITLFGKPLDLALLTQSIKQKALGFDVHSGAISLHANNLSDNIALTLERLMSEKTASRMLRILLVSLPCILLFKAWFKALKPELNSSEKLLCILCFASIAPLFLLGIDFYRWIAMGLLNSFILLAVLSHLKKQPFTAHKGYIITAIIAGIYCGPYGISTGMPERLQLLSF